MIRRYPGKMLSVPLALLALMSSSGCWVGDTPAPRLPEIDLGSSASGCETQVCNCNPDPESDEPGLAGRVYRFTMMRIEEPYALAGLLNGLWANDIDKHIMNVMFRIESASKSQTGYPFRRVVFRAASGWRQPPQLELEGQEPESYCILPNTSSEMVLEADRQCPGRCNVETVGFGSLNFFAGSQNYPLNCAPHLEVPHAIPISQVVARFVMNEDCSEFVEGRITACLERKAAEGICMCWRMSPDWEYGCEMAEPLVMAPLPEDPSLDEMRDYCLQCGTGTWIPLGASLPPPEAGSDLPPCDEPIGDGGYKVSGIFRAVEITEVFNTKESADCSETEGGE